jgi:hypothetical protein
MAKKKEVSLQLVLNEINTPIQGEGVQEFSIKFIRKTGKQKGRAKYVARAFKRGKDNRQSSGSKRGAASYRMKENKLLLLFDAEKKTPFSVPIETIIEFNEHRVTR